MLLGPPRAARRMSIILSPRGAPLATVGCTGDDGAVMMTPSDGTDDRQQWVDQYVRSVVAANPGPLIAIGLDGVVVEANEAAMALTGTPRSEILGVDFAATVVEHDAVWEAFREVMVSGSVTDVPMTVRHTSGRELSILCSASVYRDPSGEAVGILAAARDVTDENQARRELAEERDRLQLVLGSARLGMWDWNMQTDVAVVDEGFAEIIGYRLDELPQSDSFLWASMTHPEDQEIEDVLTERHAQGLDEYYDMEARMRHRDGSWVWIRDRGRIVEWDAEGRPLRMTGTIEDIGEARANAERLAAAEEQFRLAMDQSSIGMCLVSTDGRLMRVNEALCELYGRTASELIGMTWQELTHPDDLDVDVAMVAEVLAGRRDGYRLMKRFVGKSGNVVWADLSVTIVRAKDGRDPYFITQIVDVTDRHVAEQQLAQREQLLRVVLDHSPDPTFRLGADGIIDYVNQGIVDASGIPAERWVGSTIEGMGYPADLSALWSDYCRQVLTTGVPDSFEIGLDTTRGHRWAEASVAPEIAADGAVAHVVVTLRDITRRHRAEEDLLRLATRDTLTGLANRAVLADDLERALPSAARSGALTAVLMIDLDRFKNVNDSLGHGTGDELLRAVGQRMRELVRAGDLVARTGGDEFVIVMREVADEDEAAQKARAIVEAFRQPFTVERQALYATASVGVAVARKDSSPDDLLREADTALYVAKAEGRDRVMVYNGELRAAVSTRLAIESDLREALERGELEVWYQPEVDLTTGTVTAVEALLRWNHPDGVLRSAEGFVEIAEDTGLIVAIGEWVLRRACLDAAQWTRTGDGRPVVVRVNVSARQLSEPDLLAAVDGALRESALDPALLCLEITETALVRSSGHAHANLEGARARGVGIALDDFGTGYASLAYLREYPIDTLKIDRSFITRITHVEFDRQLVAGILALGVHLGLDVTAEGVETSGQADALRVLGCRGAQGYLFSRAVPGAAVPAMLEAGFVVEPVAG